MIEETGKEKAVLETEAGKVEAVKTEAIEIEADKKEKTRGTIKKYLAFHGHGSIIPDDEPNQEVAFNIENIIDYDGKEYPFIKKGAPVEFVKERDEKKGWRAYQISQPGGEKLVFMPEDPNKNYNKEKLYTGIVRVFNWRKGYGFIYCDEKIEWNGMTAKSVQVMDAKEEGQEPQERTVSQMYFGAEEIAGVEDIKRGLLEGDKVEFCLYTCERGLGAGRVKLISRTTNKRKIEWARQKYLKKCKIHRKMEEIGDYLIGNYIGALQEYFQQGSKKVNVVYEAKQEKEFDNWFLVTARTIGLEDDKIVGRGHATNKRAARQYAALDLMIQLNLITEERHKELQNIKSSTVKSEPVPETSGT